MWSHSGIALAGDRVIFAEPGGAALIALDETSGATQRIPTPTTDCHGIEATSSVDRGLLLRVADPGPGDGASGQVLEVDLSTGDIRRIDEPGGTVASVARGWRPTSTAEVRSGTHAGDVWVADGYGLDLVHIVRPSGEVVTVDGSESGIRFDCPHGVVIDDRGGSPVAVVADRGNRRLVVLDLDGSLVRTIAHPLLTSPSSLARRGDDLLVTDLFGALLRVGHDDEVEAVVAIDRDTRDREGWPNANVDGVLEPPPLAPEVLNSPHGITVGRDGSVYLTEWCLGGRQLRLTIG